MLMTSPVAECKSFTKASAQLYISHTAVIKQINQLEAQLGVKLFNRSHQGVELTKAGEQLYTETLAIMKFSSQAIQRVQDAYFSSPQILRVGSSLLYPCYDFMELWDRIHDQCPQYRLEIVSIADDAKRYAQMIDDYDFTIGPYNKVYKDQGILFYPIGYYHFDLAIPRMHPLVGKKELGFEDLDNQTILIMTPGTSPINDHIRIDIQKNYPGIRIKDIDPEYSMATFNQCVEENAILLSLDCWQHVLPFIISVPLRLDYLMPYGIMIPKESKDKLQPFIHAIQGILNLE